MMPFGASAVETAAVCLVSVDALAAFGFFFTGFLGAGACGFGCATEGFECYCSNLCHSGMCGDALQERSLVASGCLE